MFREDFTPEGGYGGGKPNPPQIVANLVEVHILTHLIQAQKYLALILVVLSMGLIGLSVGVLITALTLHDLIVPGILLAGAGMFFLICAIYQILARKKMPF